MQDTFSIKEYFLWSFRTLFKRTEYALWKGYLASLTNGFMVIAWNFTDLFLGVVSMALSSAFDQFNLELESSVKRKVNVWKLCSNGNFMRVEDCMIYPNMHHRWPYDIVNVIIVK